MDTTNYGVRNFNTYQNTCYDCFSPVPRNIPTHIDITHKQNDVNLLNKSWLNIDFEVKWKTDKGIVLRCDKETYTTNLTKDDYMSPPPSNKKVSGPTNQFTHSNVTMFIGWKNAAECMRRVEVWNGDRDTGYVHVDNDMETFLAFTKYTTREEKRQNRTSHTVFEDLLKKHLNLCGTKVTRTFEEFLGYKWATGTPKVRHELYGIKAGTIYTEKFSINVPLTEIPALRYFKEFPGCFGPITLKITFDGASLVYYMKYTEDTFNFAGARFYQFNVPYKQYCTHSGTYEDTVNSPLTDQNVTLSIVDITATSVSADIQGYNINSEGKAALTQEFSAETPYIIPCLYSQFKNYDGQIEGGVFNIEFPMAVHNLKDIHIAFPKHTMQRTTYRNPMLKNLQMKIHNVLYPKIPLNTYDRRFFKLQVNSFDPDRDYMNSLLELPNDLNNNDTKIEKCDSDDSAFVVTIPVERDNEPNAFDGYESGDENINFQLLGRIYTNDQAKCVYGHPTETEPSPYIWFTCKTFWTADTSNGLVFHRNETPNY